MCYFVKRYRYEMLSRLKFTKAHLEASALLVEVPHVIVHDFVEAVADVVNPEHIHIILSVESYERKRKLH